MTFRGLLSRIYMMPKIVGIACRSLRTGAYSRESKYLKFSTDFQKTIHSVMTLGSTSTSRLLHYIVSDRYITLPIFRTHLRVFPQMRSDTNESQEIPTNPEEALQIPLIPININDTIK